MSILSKKFKFAGIEIDNLTMSEVLEKIKEMIRDGKKGYVVTPNAAHIILLQKDKEFREAYRNAKLTLSDGISIVIASWLLGRPLKERCSGADLFLKVCELAYLLNKSIFILGGVNNSEKIAEKKLKKLYPNIKIASYSPPVGFEESEKETQKIIDMINANNTNFLFLCVGAPKSEKWIFKNISHLNINIAFNVGMALNFFAGLVPRAPKWMQKIGLEWLWRLIQEPKRLWKRYLIGNTIFMWLVFKELIKKYFYRK